MPINYSLMRRSTAPHDPNAPWLIYASAQRRHTVRTRDIAQHLADHGSPFSVGTIIGLLQDAQKCIAEHLADGDRVDLDDLGAFFTTLSSTGVPTVEEFSTDLIRRINLRWQPSKEMKKRVAQAELTEVATRPTMRRMMKEEKQQLRNGMEKGKQ